MFYTLGYIDVGSGAMLLQWIIASVIGLAIYFRRGISLLLKFFFKKSDKKDENNQNDD